MKLVFLFFVAVCTHDKYPVFAGSYDSAIGRGNVVEDAVRSMLHERAHGATKNVGTLFNIQNADPRSLLRNMLEHEY